MKWLFILCLLTILFLSSSFAQSTPPLSDKITHKLHSYLLKYPGEKAYLHLDKTVYSPGEDIWFKAYMIDASAHIPASFGTVLYVDLYSPDEQLIATRNIRIVGGLGMGDFKIPDTLKAGEYLVRAYSRYMQNFDPSFFFTQPITILGQPSPTVTSTAGSQPMAGSPQPTGTANHEVKLSLFPEGGEMIEGLEGLLAFKATDGYGNSINISGEVLNSSGKVVTHFKSHRFGLGSFHLRPRAGEKYMASFTHGNTQYTFPLPESKASGYGMSIQRYNGKISLKAQNNSMTSMDGAFIIGHIRGKVFSVIPSGQQDSLIYTAFSAADIPSGIVHFTLFDGEGKPQCERLVFIDNPKDRAVLNIESAENQYSSREETHFRLSLQDQAGEPLQGRVSVSAVEKSLFSSLKQTGNIRSYLLLESDLPGEIENPDYYFDPEHEDREYVLDLLMLTQGWRRFVWEDVLKETHEPLTYQPEDGFTIEGRLYKFNNRNKPVEGEVKLTFMENLLVRDSNMSSPEGYFQFNGIHFTDTLTAILQASKVDKKEKKKNQNDAIYIDIHNANKTPPLQQTPKTGPALAPATANTPALSQQYLEKSNKIKEINAAYTDGESIMLKEVSIEARKTRESDPLDQAVRLYGEPSRRLVFDSLTAIGARSIFDVIQGRIAGIKVFGMLGEQNVIMRGISSLSGSNSPHYLVDGVPTDFRLVNNINPHDVAYLDVLQGPRAAIFGSRGGSGIIAIYTRNGTGWERKQSRMGIINMKLPGYYLAREFYTPDYSTQKPEHAKPDFRTTLYWNPDIVVSPDSTTDLRFYTSDEKADYILYIQGITGDGKPIVGKKEFSTR